MAREDMTGRIDEGDIERNPHEPSVDRVAAGEHEDASTPCTDRRGKNHEARKTTRERLRLFDLPLPAKVVQRAGNCGTGSRLMTCGHTITPDFHGSTVTALLWTSSNGAPRSTPAMERPWGHGRYRKVHR